MAGEYLNDEALDGGLDWVVANGSKLHICSQAPTNYTEANATYALGNKTVTVNAISNGASDGRRCTISAITDGTVTATGTATHWALTNGTNTLIAAGALSGSVAVSSAGGTFSLNLLTITLRDATAA